VRFGLRTHAVAVLVGLAGCASIAGLDDDDSAARPLEAGAGDRVVQGEGGVLPGDAGPACESKELPETTLPEIVPVRAETPVTIDGDAKDWSCVDRLAFTTGDRRVDLTAGRGVARIALQYDADKLYVFATVTTARPSGTAEARANFQNDSFHLYAMGPNPSAEYTAEDHHITVDVLGQVTDFSDVAGIRPNLNGIAGAVSAVRPGPAPDLQTFDVEISLTATVLGRTSFQSGATVLMNFQVNDGPPVSNKLGYRVWFLNDATCPVTTDCDVLANSEPYCNPRCARALKLR